MWRWRRVPKVDMRNALEMWDAVRMSHKIRQANERTLKNLADRKRPTTLPS